MFIIVIGVRRSFVNCRQFWRSVGDTFTDELTLGATEVQRTTTAAVAEHAVRHDHLTAVETRRLAAHACVDVSR